MERKGAEKGEGRAGIYTTEGVPSQNPGGTAWKCKHLGGSSWEGRGPPRGAPPFATSFLIFSLLSGSVNYVQAGATSATGFPGPSTGPANKRLPLSCSTSKVSGNFQ